MLKILLYQYGKMISRLIKLSVSLLIAGLFFSTQNIKAQVFTQPGFNQVLVANGISNARVMAFAPDGRLFVAQQTGALGIIENGGLLSTPAIAKLLHSMIR